MSHEMLQNFIESWYFSRAYLDEHIGRCDNAIPTFSSSAVSRFGCTGPSFMCFQGPGVLSEPMRNWLMLSDWDPCIDAQLEIEIAIFVGARRLACN